MKRKEFIKLGAIATILGPLSTTFSSGKSRMNLFSFLENNEKDIARVSTLVQQDFTALVQWLTKNGWGTYLKNTIGVNLSLTGDALRTELLKDLDPNSLKKLTDDPTSGFDDFAGMNLIKPGFPHSVCCITLWPARE